MHFIHSERCGVSIESKTINLIIYIYLKKCVCSGCMIYLLEFMYNVYNVWHCFMHKAPLIMQS